MRPSSGAEPNPDPARAAIAERDQLRLRKLALDALGRSPEHIESLPAGLGTRRFHRLHFAAGTPSTLIARIEDDGALRTETATSAAAEQRAASEIPSVPEPPAWLPEPPLEPLRGFLEAAGLPVPRSFLHQPALGIDLLEDVGDQTLGDATGDRRAALYREACALVPRLQRLTADPSEIPAFGRRFDRQLVETKAWKWLHWTIPLLLGRAAEPEERAQIGRLFDRIADLALAGPLRLSHRDYKAENLHLCTQRAGGVGRAGHELVLIDVQGAFMAPPEYDLVCLLYDLQQDLAEDFVQECLARIRPELPDTPSAQESRLRFDALAVARLCKDISHVVHAVRVRGDRRRWHELPRGLELLSRAADRLESRFSEIATLSSVIQALTPRVLAADSAGRG